MFQGLRLASFFLSLFIYFFCDTANCLYPYGACLNSQRKMHKDREQTLLSHSSRLHHECKYMHKHMYFYCPQIRSNLESLLERYKLVLALSSYEVFTSSISGRKGGLYSGSSNLYLILQMMWGHIKNILTSFSRCLPNQHQLSPSGKLNLPKFQTILQSQLAVTVPGLQALESQLPYAGESLPSPPASRGTLCTHRVSLEGLILGSNITCKCQICQVCDRGRHQQFIVKV